jgi:uncharacterized repeat protein (TIGR03803 family)
MRFAAPTFRLQPLTATFPSATSRVQNGLSEPGASWLVRSIALWTALILAAAVASPAQTFTSLFSFDGTDGEDPSYGSLVQGTDGNFYGTAAFGGANSAGTVFKITPERKLTTLYNFCSQTNCTDGEYPLTGLVLATNGNFYGTTSIGGAYNYGTVFEITAAGKLTTLHSFCTETNCADGENPRGTLIQATNGNFYGTTFAGGNSQGAGTVFEITPTGTLTVLYSFCSKEACDDGVDPAAGVVQGADGNFYGTTPSGGHVKGRDAAGIVFKLTPAGKLTVLYNFCSLAACADGAFPYSSLVQASNGNFYGTTENGGTHDSEGSVYEITPTGTLTTLYSFCSLTKCEDGISPLGPLVIGTDGNFYGTTFEGGGTGCIADHGCGTIFELTPGGTLTTLQSLDGSDGQWPYDGLMQATNGTFYGTTDAGGANSEGTIFSVSNGLGPFVETLPISGKVGAKVTILGSDLTGTTSVTFNGTAATFKVSTSGTFITTTVPTGATTGTVEVVTPTGTLSSNTPFTVK